jgi:hypothetical protein
MRVMRRKATGATYRDRTDARKPTKPTVTRKICHSIERPPETSRRGAFFARRSAFDRGEMPRLRSLRFRHLGHLSSPLRIR